MLTVFIATRDRALILREVLESYCELQHPSGGWKLVVIDNGSTDTTAEVVSSFARRIPVKYLFEGRPGKNLALNAGLEFLEGDLAVFADDDAFPRPDWLIQFRSVSDTERGHSIFGGAVVPRWEISPPFWVQWVKQGPVYTVTEPVWNEGPIDPWLVFGPNMAVRSDVFRSGAHFDTAMGPRGQNYPMGSETEFVIRLARAGHKAWHTKKSVVEHLIRKEQLQRTWVWRRAIRYGRGQYRLNHLGGEADKVPMGIFWPLYLEIVKKSISVISAFMFVRQEALFDSMWYLNFYRGQVIEARNVARERRRMGTPDTVQAK